MRPRTFYPLADSPAERRERSVGKVRLGERSLSGVPECLSPLAEYSTNERAALTPAVKGGASAPHKVMAPPGVMRPICSLP